MSIDITNLLSISNNSLFQTTTKQATNTGDFSTALLNALNATQTTSDNNPLYTTLTAATNTAYGNASTQYMQYLSQYNSSSNNLKGYMTNFSTGTQQANDSLIVHFQSQTAEHLISCQNKPFKSSNGLYMRPHKPQHPAWRKCRKTFTCLINLSQTNRRIQTY